VLVRMQPYFDNASYNVVMQFRRYKYNKFR
jgi:hypothetical protein